VLVRVFTPPRALIAWRSASSKGLAMAPKGTVVATSPFQTNVDQWTKLLSAAAEKSPEKVRPYAAKAAPFAAMAIAAVITAWPFIVQYTKLVREYIDKLPEFVAMAILGFLLCFFGGMFPLCIAAVEAWSLCGGKEAIKNVGALLGEAEKLKKENEADDLKDDDGDGVADVKQITGQQLLLRKGHLALKACDPQTVSNALSGLYMGWVGVLATLKIQFAKTITLGASIGDMIYKPASRYVEPALKKALPEEYEKWVTVAIKYSCRAVAVSIAWWIQRVISGFHSALRGGLIFSRNILSFASKRGFLKDFDEKTSNLDEVVGYAVACVGFLFQWKCGFSVPMVCSLFLWPVQVLEGYIAWQVSS